MLAFPSDLQSLCVSDCPLSVGDMTAIPSGVPLSCHLKEHCTAIECCLDLQSPLQRTFHFYLDLDLCLQTLKLGIENLTYEKTLLSYSYGLILMCIFLIFTLRRNLWNLMPYLLEVFTLCFSCKINVLILEYPNILILL